MKINKIFKFLKIKRQFYSQNELLELKGSYPKRIKAMDTVIKQAKTNENPIEFLEQLAYRTKLATDQIKIKKAISYNNTKLGIDNLIFLRESVFQKLELLKTLSKNKDHQKEFFISLKKKNFTIENVIDTYQIRLQNIENKLKQKNNSFLTNKLLMLETI